MALSSEYKFYMARVKEDGEHDGVFSVDTFKNLEVDFPGLRYKSFKGLNDYGEPIVYSESYVEEDGTMVVLGENSQRKQTELVLTLLFFDDRMGGDIDVASQYARADKVYHDFIEFLDGYKLAYYDTARKRKVVMYLSSATSPSADTLCGLPYKQVELKFKNIFGRTFNASDNIFVTPTN